VTIQTDALADWAQACEAANALAEALLPELTADPVVHSFMADMNELVIVLLPRDLATWFAWCGRFDADSADGLVVGCYLVVSGRSESGVAVRLRGFDVPALLAAHDSDAES
jgi:hypothetical protein